MSDEKTEKSTPIHEMSETPLGGNKPAEEEVPETEQPTQEAPVEEPLTMEAAMSGTAGDYSGTFKGLTPGDVVEGIVVHIDREGVLVDVGTKSEGIIKPGELAKDQSLEPEQVVSVGEKIKVYVVEPEGSHGGPILSKKRADFENAWDRVQKTAEDETTIKAMVTDRVKGGLVVDLGIRGFVPASHVGSGRLKNLDKFVGQSMQFKVIEVDRERRKVVLSNRLAVEEEQEVLRANTLATLKEGQIREGVVRRITDYGAFVDLGGVDGLLHISEMSWTRINHPSEVVKVGQKIQIMVLKMNLDQGRVSLGLRQILPDPWEDVKRIHNTGDIIKGTVTRMVPFGAFVQVEGGVEGIIPNSELAYKRVNNPEEVVSIGQEVEIKIIDLRPDERRLTLSLKQLQTPPERPERAPREDVDYRSYSQSRVEEKTTIADLIGEQLGDLGFAAPEKEKAPRKKTPRTARSSRKEIIEEAEAIAEAEEIMAVEEEMAAEEAAAEVEATVEESVETEAPAEEPAAEAEAETAEVEATAEESVETEVSAEETAAEAETAEVEATAEESVETEAPAEEPAAEAEKTEE